MSENEKKNENQSCCCHCWKYMLIAILFLIIGIAIGHVMSRHHGHHMRGLCGIKACWDGDRHREGREHGSMCAKEGCGEHKCWFEHKADGKCKPGCTCPKCSKKAACMSDPNKAGCPMMDKMMDKKEDMPKKE